MEHEAIASPSRIGSHNEGCRTDPRNGSLRARAFVLAAKDVNASGEVARGFARSRIPPAKQVSEMLPCKL